MKTILVVATLDTKGTEAEFVKKQIEALKAKALLLDAGILGSPTVKPDITREEVATAAEMTIEEVKKIPNEAEALEVMARGASVIALELYQAGKIHGILAIGGGMGTVLGTSVMQNLPLGVPKVMVSSQAANPDFASNIVRAKDVCMFHSVTDIAGLNRLTKIILTKACGAIVGMANAEIKQEESEKKVVTLCAKGATEVANRKIRQKLTDAGYEVITFHCFGYGPVYLEQVIKEGYVNGGCIELSSDWVDRLFGGSSYPPDDRYENAGKLGLPQVFVPGSCDFIATAPGKFPGRKVHPHNKAVWLYRTTKEELKQAGREIGEKLSKSKGPVTVVIPLRGFSAFDREGGPLYDPDADAGFIEGISVFEGKIKIRKVDAHIFDDEFVDAVMEAFLENVALVEKANQS